MKNTQVRMLEGLVDAMEEENITAMNQNALLIKQNILLSEQLRDMSSKYRALAEDPHEFKSSLNK